MATVSNKARGARVFNVVGGQSVVVAPGETRTFVLADPQHPVYAAWVKAGDVEIEFDPEVPAVAPAAAPAPGQEPTKRGRARASEQAVAEAIAATPAVVAAPPQSAATVTQAASAVAAIAPQIQG
ncbi:hypothetical protein [Rhodovastum atsumiense]|uniref:DUF2635 domain-containing protein n=1 Tax=Rhodovastum atsumiense TaxID=504468 RepID=A0A5M6IUC3_9PROT|nr:hypothetical protein [Rhodovastum atsumiense]KAA5611872.1 hypothetical protein F1189_12630 [Rhodovastum atsumiense]